MALYIVRRKNPFYKLSTWLEDDEKGMVEPVKMAKDESGKMKVMLRYGIMMPIENVREHLVQVMKYGYDHQGIKGHIRRN